MSSTAANAPSVISGPPLAPVTNLASSLQGLSVTATSGKKGAATKSNKKGKTPAGKTNTAAAAAQDKVRLWKERVELLKKTPLDAAMEAEYKDAWHVYRDYNDNDWKVVLTRTEISSNTNSFYTIYLLEHDDSPLYGVWMRWGRIGAPKGSAICDEFEGDLIKAKKSFEQKFKEKTNQTWSEREKFQPTAGFHTILHVVDATTGSNPVVLPRIDANVSYPRSQLNQRVLDLVSTVFGFNSTTIADLARKDVDAKGSPFGCLSLEHVKAGYSALQAIDELVAKGAIATDPDLLKANNDFYAAIPHKFEKSAIILKSTMSVREKIQLLQVLNSDINKVVDALGPLESTYLPDADQKYLALDSRISLMDVNSNEFDVISDYLENSHGIALNYHLNISEVFHYHQQEQIDNFVSYNNKQLLWYWSKPDNLLGILKGGWSWITTPQTSGQNVPRFGNGIYFRDRVAKGQGYFFGDKEEEAILLLCEVALGRSYDAPYNQNYTKRWLSSMKVNSIKGVGMYSPKPLAVPVKLLDDVSVPSGVTVNSPNYRSNWYSKPQNYNDWVVYDNNQVIIRYLVRTSVYRH